MSLSAKAIGTLAKAVVVALPKSRLTTGEDADRYMLAGDEIFRREPGDGFCCGFGKAVLTPDDVASGRYFLAGYDSNNPALSVLDDMYARAVFLDDGTGRGGVVLCAIDAVGMSRRDVNEIRRAVLANPDIPRLRSVNIACTHSHSAIDTQGLWGKRITKSGRDEAFMARLRQRAAQAIVDACSARKNGRLFLSTLQTTGLQYDCRTPDTFDSTLTRLRFAAEDGSEIVLVNFASHAELMGSKTKAVSADFPAYMIREIEGAGERVDAVFFNGAIGGMISAKEIKKVYRHEIDCEAYTRQFGKTLGELVNALTDETEIAPLLNVSAVPLRLPAENYVLILARLLNVLNNDVVRGSKRSRALVLSETGYLELGDRQLGVFLIPGELFPELWNGAFLSAAESATGREADYTPLRSLCDCERQFVVGLCNDELGYILPDNDFWLNEKTPYLNAATDRHDRRHYEETNSIGPETARTILTALAGLIDRVQGRNGEKQ